VVDARDSHNMVNASDGILDTRMSDIKFRFVFEILL
jgi:hypothetical protein